jgi:hypothetical protein
VKVHYHGHKRVPQVPIPSQLNLVHTLGHPIFLISTLVSPSHLCLGLPTGHFPSCFPTKALYAYRSPLPYVLMSYLPHLPWLRYSNKIFHCSRIYLLSVSLISGNDIMHYLRMLDKEVSAYPQISSLKHMNEFWWNLLKQLSHQFYSEEPPKYKFTTLPPHQSIPGVW